MCDSWICPVHCWVNDEDKHWVLDCEVDPTMRHPDSPDAPELARSKAGVVAHALTLQVENKLWSEFNVMFLLEVFRHDC